MEEYRDLFLAEANEYLQSMSDCLLELEKDPSATAYLTELFRASHSLKGMSGTMGFELIMELTHTMENLLDRLRTGEISLGTSLINIFFECVDQLQLLVESLDEQEPFEDDVRALIKKLQEWHPVSSGSSAAEKPSIEEYTGEGEREAAASEEKESSTVEDPSSPVEALPLLENSSEIYGQLNEFEKEMLKEALSKEEEAYLLTVSLKQGSLLKSVRAYMVYKAAEKYGEIVKTLPSLQDLEDENFDLKFSLVLVGNPNLFELRGSIENISEIEKMHISRFDIAEPVEQGLTELSSGAAESRAPAGDYENEESGQDPKIGEEQEQKSSKAAAATLNKSAEKTVRVETAKLDNLVNLVGELVINRTRVVELGKDINEELESSLEQLERITTDLQGAIMSLRMVPIKQVFDRFPRMVRDLSQERNKKVELVLSGEETELDRTIVNQIGDPLVHLLRNSVDHGIESEDVRVKKGKKAAGTIHLSAHHEGSHVVVTVEDDGAGIDAEKVKEKAVSRGVISSEEVERLSHDEAVNLIFRSGFSTTDEVTDVSGRGVGMDVVKSMVEGLNGTVEVKTELDEGSRFILRLPLTLAIIRTLMVKSAGHIYAVPIETVNKNLLVEPGEIRTIQQNKIITIRDEVLPLHCLAESLGMGDLPEMEEYPVVVVQAGERKAAFIVDELIGQQEVVIKSFTGFIKDIREVAGATILGDGSVSLILDIPSLLEDGRVDLGKESANYR